MGKAGIRHFGIGLVILIISVGWADSSWGYAVSYSVELDRLTEEADVIFKGTAVDTLPLEDAWFRPCSAFIPRQTAFKVVSVLKGALSQSTVSFRHYDNDPTATTMSYMPQHYAFEPGRTYIVFTDRVDDTGDLRQIWLHHKSKSDQGALMCVDAEPITETNAADLYWQELTALLRSTLPSDVIYGIGQLDTMSGGKGHYGATRDFARENVVEEVHRFVQSNDEDIVRAAIPVIGSHNPYLYDERTMYWLATVGSAEVTGLAKMDPEFKNIGAERYWDELVAVADGNGSIETRALAIRALGLMGDGAIRSPINRWLMDETAEIRAAATVLLTDFPDSEGVETLRALAEDSSAAVRVSLARAIGFSQQHDLLDVLGTLLSDDVVDVRREAAQSLLSFSVEGEAVASVFKEQLGKEEFGPLFLNALAKKEPEPYLNDLAQAVESKEDPRNWSGEMPLQVSRKLILTHLRTQENEALASGDFDRYFDAIEKAQNSGSNGVRAVYAFYMARGLKERAGAYGAWAIENIPYDVIDYFRQVDDNPAYYDRESECFGGA